MYCRKLTDAEILDVYSTAARRHFPANELKPIRKVAFYLEEEKYLGYGLFRDDTLLSYALFLRLPAFQYMLLDYYAVMEEYRNDGLGSEFLQLIKQELSADTTLSLKGFFIESENPDFAEESSEKEIRAKRIGFYERNTAVFTGILSTLFDVPYKILYFPLKDTKLLSPVDYYKNLDFIYHSMFSSDHYNEFVEISYN